MLCAGADHIVQGGVSSPDQLILGLRWGVGKAIFQLIPKGRFLRIPEGSTDAEGFAEARSRSCPVETIAGLSPLSGRRNHMPLQGCYRTAGAGWCKAS